MRIGFYRGCCFQGLDFVLFDVIKRVFSVFGVELPEVRKTICCGGNVIDEESRFLSTIINARNIAAAEKENLDLLISCNTCFMVINRAKKLLDSSETVKEKVNKILEEENLSYSGRKKLWHILPFIVEKIGFEKLSKHIKISLPYKFAPYYGCHLKYPEKIVKSGSLEKIIKLCGGTPIHYQEEDTCCGYHAIYTDKATSLKKIKRIVDSIKENEAEFIVTPCPLCFKGFDMMQKEAKVEKEIPVLFLPELIALSLGFSHKDSGITYHKIPVKL